MTKSFEWRGPDQAVTLVVQTEDGPQVVWEGALTSRRPPDRPLPEDHPYVRSWLAIGHLVEVSRDGTPPAAAAADPAVTPAAPEQPAEPAPDAGPRKSRQKEA